MTITKIQKGLVLAILTTGLCAAGCELIVDFDRTRIPIEDAGTSVPDATTDGAPGTDAGTDATDESDADAADLDAGDADDDASDGAADQ